MAKEVKLIRSDFEKAAGDYFEATHELSKINAEKALKMQLIEKEYEEQIRVEQTKLEVSESTMSKYAKDNKDLLLTTKSKSAQVGRVVFSFRSGKPKLVLLGETKWEDVTAKAKELLPDYVRQIDDLEKDKILKDADALKEKLEAIGVKVASEEVLSFKLKD